MKLEAIKQFAAVIGVIESIAVFACLLGCAVTPGVAITSLDAFMAMLIISSGVLLFITNFEG
jgi:hypothetical protein